MESALQRLLHAVEIKFGGPILQKGDCVALSDDIFNKTNQMVNYNTIRRLYGLAKTVNPRKSTLEILANYAGYKSWHSLQNSSYSSREKEMVALSHYFINDNNTFAEKYVSANLRGTHQPMDMIAIAFLFRSLLQEKDYKTVTKLLRNDYWQPFTIPSNAAAAQVSFTAFVAPTFLSITDNNLIREWIKDTYYPSIFLSFHVNMGDLDGQYGQQISLLAEHGTSDERRFAYSLLAYQAALNNDIPSFLAYHNSLNNLPTPSSTLYDPLLARLRLITLLAADVATDGFVVTQEQVLQLAEKARSSKLLMLYTLDTTAFLILTQQWEALNTWISAVFVAQQSIKINDYQHTFQVYAAAKAIIAALRDDWNGYNKWLSASQEGIRLPCTVTITEKCVAQARLLNPTIDARTKAQ